MEKYIENKDGWIRFGFYNFLLCFCIFLMYIDFFIKLKLMKILFFNLFVCFIFF